MTDNNGVQEIKKREFFVKKFVPKLDEWKKNNKEKGGTQKAFAKLIGVSEDMIKAYRTGEAYPREKTLKEIRRVLGVSEDYFTPTTEKELYEYSQGYMTDIGENRILPYCEDIGLDPQFLVVISHLIGESLGDQFPFWTPISMSAKTLFRLEDRKMYDRPDPFVFWSDSAEMDPDLKMFQIEITGSDDKKEKKRLTLSDPDLRFLRNVQDEVRDFVEYLFHKRKKELRREVEEASRRSVSQIEGGGESHRKLTGEELNEIDKYYSGYDRKSDQKHIEGRNEDGDDQTSRKRKI